MLQMLYDQQTYRFLLYAAVYMCSLFTNDFLLVVYFKYNYVGLFLILIYEQI